MLTEALQWLKTVLRWTWTMRRRSSSLQDLTKIQSSTRFSLADTAHKVTTYIAERRKVNDKQVKNACVRAPTPPSSTRVVSSMGTPPPTRSHSHRSSLVTLRQESDPTALFMSPDVDFSTQTVRINVGGLPFTIGKQYLNRYPETVLGSLSPESPYFNRLKREYCFDRNPSLFPFILDLYRINEVHLPRNVCGKSALRELEFWRIPIIWVSACCWGSLHDFIQDEQQFKDLVVGDKGITLQGRRAGWLRHKLWANLYNPRRSTVSRMKTELVVLGLLVVELVLKLASSPNIHLLLIVYGLSLVGSVLGHIAEFILSDPDKWKEENSLNDTYIFCRCVRWLRIVRFLELLDWNASSLTVMWVATMRCRMELLLLLLVFAIHTFIFGSIAFFVETISGEQTDSKPTGGEKVDEGPGFASSLLGGVYWAIITMTTVGYGDITPSTTLGRAVGAICSVSGVIVLALPVAILTESFQQYHLRQKIRAEKRRRQNAYLRDPIPVNAVGPVQQVSI
ncbi:potassium voltage-gated channel subfamily B member 1-like [Babylonia areolata]|uniref:potassium voltage-gated channel subfamily B member 1-like n=1 Tax=Babylonia areolata TaxID=304850 RepID=UPI003FD5E066